MPRLPRAIATALLIGVAALASTHASAQTSGVAPYLAVVTDDDVDVMAGASFRHYSFGRLRQGDVVRVIDSKAGWGRVETVGPTFKRFFGYVKYPSTERTYVTVADDGMTLRANGTTELFAPNFDEGNLPQKSWMRIGTVARGRTLAIIKTTDFRNERVHHVELPADAHGFIKLAYLRRATPAEQVAWTAAITPSPLDNGMRVTDPIEVGVNGAVNPAAPSGPIQTALRNQVPQIGGTPGTDVAPGTGGAMVPDRLNGNLAATVNGPVAVRAIRPVASAAAVAKLKQLESAYARLLEEPLASAEVDPLRNLFVQFAKENPRSEAIQRHANIRAKQLELWGEAQKRKEAIDKIKQKLDSTAKNARRAGWSLETYGQYVAMGRLDASSVYNGGRLPKLFRIRDLKTGRTLGYLKPDEQSQLAGRIGEVVGIVGTKQQDPKLRVTILNPTKIDTVTIEQPAPLPPPVFTPAPAVVAPPMTLEEALRDAAAAASTRTENTADGATDTATDTEAGDPD